MTPLANLLYASAQVLDIAINILYLLIIIRAVLSWVRPDPHHPLVQVLIAVTEPVLFPIRRLLYRYAPQMMIDLSPLVAILALVFVQSFLVKTLMQIAGTLRF